MAPRSIEKWQEKEKREGNKDKSKKKKKKDQAEMVVPAPAPAPTPAPAPATTPVAFGIPVTSGLDLPFVSSTQARLYSMIAACGAAPESGNASKNRESALPAITPVFKTPLPDGPQ